MWSARCGSVVVKTALLSHGVETAADVVEIKEVAQIPSIGNRRAKWLLEWRRDLEQKFVLDPNKGVPPETSLRTERDVEALRIRLESELSGGARHLRDMKQEIETKRQKLQPALAQARHALAQAEMDLIFAINHDPVGGCFSWLMLGYLIGCVIKV